MKIRCLDVKSFDGTLRLGVQTNKGLTQETAEWKANAWGIPGRMKMETAGVSGTRCVAKSYKIVSFVHTDYYGAPQSEETGYATIVVQYFTTAEEGTPIDSNLTLGGPHGLRPWIPTRAIQ